MPMDAGAIGIRPVTPQRPTGDVEGVQRRDDGSSSGGFRPQTNVALKTAIEDLSGTLSKISMQEKFGINKMPKDIGDIVKNILQQSFSMNETLTQGIGSTIESQRFSMEQLSVFARMLSQIGALADKGFSMELSDQTKTLLNQFKNLLVSQEGGSSLEPVLMSKAAFELIDAKNAEQLPQALYEILAMLSMPTAQVNQPQESEGMQFLKQLVQYFMPRPSESEGEGQQQGQTQQGQKQNQSPTQRFLNSMFKQFGQQLTQQPQQNSQTQQNQPQQNSQTQQNQPQQNSQAQQNQPQQNSQTQQNQPQQNSQTQQNQPQQNSQTQQQPSQIMQQMTQNQNQTQQQNSQTQNQPQQNSQQTSQNSQAQQSGQTQQNQPTSEEFLARQQEMKNQMQLAKNTLLRQPMQNTPQTMDTMKNLAQMLMKNPAMNPRETAMLQNFVNNSQTMMSEGEARHLQNLLRLCQQNVPITVQQAAIQQNLPDLPRLWAFMQLCDMAGLTAKMNARAFKRAGKDVAEFANAMRQAMGGDNSGTTQQTQRSFQMMLPLYLGDNETSYPTYLSVYDENEKDKETGADKKETWVRICVLTDNIGAVELTFRIYEENRLDMRFYFSQKSVAREFRNYIPDIETSLKDSSLNIGEVRIGSVGEKMTVP